MKTFIIGLLCIGLTSLTHAQNDLAMLNESHHTPKVTKTVLKNSQYLMVADQSVKRIKTMQQRVAAFNMKDLAIFTPGTPASYDVTFTEGADQVQARYNENGIIEFAKETYQDIRLPYEVAYKLSKDYPGWNFTKTKCTISYANEQAVQITYKIGMQKAGKSKTVKRTL